MRSVAPAISDAIRISSRRSSTLSTAFSLELARVEPGLLVDRLDQVLADARLGVLVDLHERALPRELLLGRERDELGAPALLHRLERILVLLLGDVVGVLRGIGHGALEGLADVGGEALPQLLV